jgi:hypothetical protein
MAFYYSVGVATFLRSSSIVTGRSGSHPLIAKHSRVLFCIVGLPLNPGCCRPESTVCHFSIKGRLFRGERSGTNSSDSLRTLSGLQLE